MRGADSENCGPEQPIPPEPKQTFPQFVALISLRRQAT
jgi:hypothetical protein